MSDNGNWNLFPEAKKEGLEEDVKKVSRPSIRRGLGTGWKRLTEQKSDSAETKNHRETHHDAEGQITMFSENR